MASKSIMRIELAQSKETAQIRAAFLQQRGFQVAEVEKSKTVWVSKAKEDGNVDTLVTYIDEDDDDDDWVWVVIARKAI